MIGIKNTYSQAILADFRVSEVVLDWYGGTGFLFEA